MNKEIYTIKVFGTFKEVKNIFWLVLGTIVFFLLGINAYKSIIFLIVNYFGIFNIPIFYIR